MQHPFSPNSPSLVPPVFLGWLLGAGLILAVGCGGNVITGGGGSGGSGGSTGTTTSTTGTTTTPTPTGPACQSHDDCPGGVCVFATGTCSIECGFTPPCPNGQICDECATSSCPACDDCKSACVPAPPGQCDAHDDCAPGEVCLFFDPVPHCVPGCNAMGECDDPSLACATCGTAACLVCQACMGACLPPTM